MVQNFICHLDGKNYTKIQNLADVFSNFSLNKNRLYVEVKYLQKLSQAGVIRLFTTKENKFLSKLCDKFNQKEFAKVQKIDERINHDVKAVEVYLREKLLKTTLKDVEHYVHFCLSSEDINNLAYGLMLAKGKDTLSLRIKGIIKGLKVLADSSVSYPMMSLTHG